MEQMTPELAAQILSRAGELKRAQLLQAGTTNPFGIQRISIDLSTIPAGGFRQIASPFVSVYVESATDQTVKISLQPDTIDQYQGTITLKQNDSVVFDQVISKAFLSWTAQAGKTVTLVFFVAARFQSGSQISISGGGVSISEGTSFATSQVNLTGTTATSVLAQNVLRKVASVQNNTGADVYLGGLSVSNTGVNQGFKITNGGTFQWKNTAQLWAWTASTGIGDVCLTILEES